MKKSQPRAQLQLSKTLNNASLFHHKQSHPLLAQSSILSSHKEQHQPLLTHLAQYQHHYERSKLICYFRGIKQIVQDQEKTGLNFIETQIGKVAREFQRKRYQICCQFQQSRFRKDKHCSDSHYHPDKVNLQIELFEVQVRSVEEFKNDFQKYMVRPKSYDQFEIHQNTSKTKPQQKQLQDRGVQTDILPEPRSYHRQYTHSQRYAQPSKDMNNALDDLLSCDEDIDQRLSPSSMRRRKYAVGRKDVIREQDQFSESSIVSDS